MSLVDDVFKKLPAPLLTKWGHNITYVKAATTETYDPATGTISGSETTVTVKALITSLNPKEFRGEFQTTDIKIIIGNTELGDYYPNIRDRVRYTEAGATREGRIIDVETYRGDQAILHNLIVRPQ